METNKGTNDCPDSSHAILPDQFQHYIHNENVAYFTEMVQAFSDAENYLKLVELDSTLDIPSINELRYVGFHMLKSMKLGLSYTEQAEELRRAKRHCERACYDAVELGVLVLLDEIRKFQDKYKKYNVIDNLSEYHSLLDSCEDIKDFIIKTSNEDKPSYYRDLFDKYIIVRDIKKKLERVEPSVKNSANLIRNNKFISVVTLIMTLLSLILGIMQYKSSTQIEELNKELKTLSESNNKASVENIQLRNENLMLKHKKLD